MRLLFIALSIAVISCSATRTSVITDSQLKDLRQHQQHPGTGDAFGYRFSNLDRGKEDEENKLFLCLSFSGGGTRAAALAYGAMIALRQTKIDWPRHERLLDEVDCISSVSGGSFTAAYYGLFRDDLFVHFEDKFLYRNIEGGLGLQLLYPWNWPWLASPYYSRIDLAADLYNAQIFDHKTYNDLLSEKRQRPFIILNATNIGTGDRFSFTQDQFDLIGSDLGPYPVARAVAASSAFPFLLSPLTLENYQAVSPKRFNDSFPIPIAYTIVGFPEDYYLNPSRYFWAQNNLNYVNAPQPYLHLMDGGLADNIGLRAIVEAYEQSSGFIFRHEGSMKRLAIIDINARAQSADTISDVHHTPHIIPTVAMATATIAMDNYSFDTVDFTNRMMTVLQQNKVNNPSLQAPKPYVIDIEFDAIPNKQARDAFLAIGTNFHLPREQVKALIYMGCTLLKKDPIFLCMLDNFERHADKPESDSACMVTSNGVHPVAAEEIVCPDPGTWPPARKAFSMDAPTQP